MRTRQTPHAEAEVSRLQLSVSSDETDSDGEQFQLAKRIRASLSASKPARPLPPRESRAAPVEDSSDEDELAAGLLVSCRPDWHLSCPCPERAVVQSSGCCAGSRILRPKTKRKRRRIVTQMHSIAPGSSASRSGARHS